MSNATCSICRNDLNNVLHQAKEMMFGTGDTFEYLECARCGCVQITDIPADMGKYYPANYYSYSSEGEGYILRDGLAGRVKKYLKKCLTSYYKFDFNLTGSLLGLFVKDGFGWLKKGIVNFESHIVDVGCGAGNLLLNMKYNGFRNLQGVDPYIPADIEYQCGVRIEKKSIHELDGNYDLIMMHHSFEHMSDPIAICTKAFELLSDDGYLLLNIPVAACYAWRHYGTYWVQLDAPRHFFLHTTQSISRLAADCGFVLEDVLYNSTEFQFTGSELYLKGGNFFSNDRHFTPKQVNVFRKRARALNEQKDGDTAVFYLKKKAFVSPE